MKNKTRNLLLCCSLLLSTCICANAASNRIGVIIPMTTESAWFMKQIKQAKPVRHHGVNFILGKIGGHPIVFTNSSVGKVNASIAATQLINTFHPRLILMSGSSGSINTKLPRNAVVIGKTVVDVDLGKLNPKIGMRYPNIKELYHPSRKATLPLTFNADPKLLQLSKPLLSKHVIFGRIATGDNLPDSPELVTELKQNRFDVVEMEGAALMHVCWYFRTPCLVFRGVSNVAAQDFGNQQITPAGTAAAQVLVRLIKQLPAN